jgi:hypothetical protein
MFMINYNSELIIEVPLHKLFSSLQYKMLCTNEPTSIYAFRKYADYRNYSSLLSTILLR